MSGAVNGATYQIFFGNCCVITRFLTTLPYTFSEWILEPAMKSIFTGSWSAQMSYRCNITHSNFVHLPSVEVDSSTLALHLRQILWVPRWLPRVCATAVTKAMTSCFIFPVATNSDSIFLVTFMLTLTLSKTLFPSNSWREIVAGVLSSNSRLETYFFGRSNYFCSVKEVHEDSIEVACAWSLNCSKTKEWPGVWYLRVIPSTLVPHIFGHESH